MSEARTEASAGGDLRLEAVTKRFGSFVAVDDLHLTVPQGSFFALLGPSGCGKTTTLRMVAGLEEPTSGRVLIGERDITARRPYQRPVNTVFQSYALFPHLDVFENVAFGLRRRRVKDLRARVQQMLELVELSGYERRKPGQLSGGQQQRVALARAIVNRPQVLLLDEPLGALDLKLRRQMQLELKHIQTEVGITFVHVTHDQEEAMTMADTIAVMNGGRIEQLGEPVDLYESPHTTFVANFLGQSNLVEARVVARDGADVVVDAHGTRLAIPVARMHGSGPSVFVGVRPEKVNLTLIPAAGTPTVDGDRNCVPCVLTDSSFTGVSRQYSVRTPWGQQLTVFAQNAGSGEQLCPGDEVHMHWERAHTFALDGSQRPDAGATLVDDSASSQPVGVAR